MAYNFGAGELDDLLEMTAELAMIDGTAILAMAWIDADAGNRKGVRGDASANDGRLPQFHLINPSNAQRLGSGALRIWLEPGWLGEEPEALDFKNGDWIFIEWPLPGIGRKGRSPVDRVADLHLRHDELMDVELEYARAFLANDTSLRTERARWLDQEKVIQEMRSINVQIASELYDFVTDKPMTDFFDGYQVMQTLKRRAIVREYLLERFNVLVSRFCEEVEPDSEKAKIVLLDYPSAEAIEDAFQRFARKEISIAEAMAIGKPREESDAE